MTSIDPAHVCDPSSDLGGGPRTRIRVWRLMLAAIAVNGLADDDETASGVADALGVVNCPRCAFLAITLAAADAALYGAELTGGAAELVRRLELGVASFEAEMACTDVPE